MVKRFDKEKFQEFLDKLKDPNRSSNNPLRTSKFQLDKPGGYGECQIQIPSTLVEGYPAETRFWIGKDRTTNALILLPSGTDQPNPIDDKIPAIGKLTRDNFLIGPGANLFF